MHIDVYLANPYTHWDPDVKRRRFELASQAAAAIFRMGLVVFSPIAMTHPMALYGKIDGLWDTWARFDHAFILSCRELWVLKLPGWDKSTGVNAEIEFAEENGIPVKYVEPDILLTQEEIVYVPNPKS